MYSDTRISPDHAKILVEYIDGSHPVLEMLNKSIDHSKWIMVFGE